MKIDAEVTVKTDNDGNIIVNHVIVPIDIDIVDADEDSIYEYAANSDELYHAFGYTPSKDEFEIDNINDIIEDLTAHQTPSVDVAADCDYNYLRKQLVGILRRYFKNDDAGNPNKTYDDTYTAQEAIDDIHEIIGDI